MKFGGSKGDWRSSASSMAGWKGVGSLAAAIGIGYAAYRMYDRGMNRTVQQAWTRIQNAVPFLAERMQHAETGAGGAESSGRSTSEGTAVATSGDRKASRRKRPTPAVQGDGETVVAKPETPGIQSATRDASNPDIVDQERIEGEEPENREGDQF